MSLTARLDRLEKDRAQGAAELCNCGLPARIVWGDDGTGTPRPDPGPATCPICGRVRLTMRVVYGDESETERE